MSKYVTVRLRKDCLRIVGIVAVTLILALAAGSFASSVTRPQNYGKPLYGVVYATSSGNHGTWLELYSANSTGAVSCYQDFYLPIPNPYGSRWVNGTDYIFSHATIFFGLFHTWQVLSGGGPPPDFHSFEQTVCWDGSQ